jgi:hypothetical protein
MFVRSRTLTLVLVLAAALLMPSVTPAQTSGAQAGDWAALNAVASGSKLFVKLKDGKSIEGRFNSVNDSALSLTVKGKPSDVRREDVRSVYRTESKSATKATLIGTGVGAGAGAVAGAVGSSGDAGFDKFDKAATTGLTVLGAAAGALTGYLIGRHGSKRVLVYEAH